MNLEKKIHKDLNLDFKSFRENENVITRVFNNNITRNAYKRNDRNNNVYHYCEKKNH